MKNATGMITSSSHASAAVSHARGIYVTIEDIYMQAGTKEARERAVQSGTMFLYAEDEWLVRSGNADFSADSAEELRRRALPAIRDALGGTDYVPDYTERVVVSARLGTGEPLPASLEANTTADRDAPVVTTAVSLGATILALDHVLGGEWSARRIDISTARVETRPRVKSVRTTLASMPRQTLTAFEVEGLTDTLWVVYGTRGAGPATAESTPSDAFSGEGTVFADAAWPLEAVFVPGVRELAAWPALGDVLESAVDFPEQLREWALRVALARALRDRGRASPEVCWIASRPDATSAGVEANGIDTADEAMSAFDPRFEAAQRVRSLATQTEQERRTADYKARARELNTYATTLEEYRGRWDSKSLAALKLSRGVRKEVDTLLCPPRSSLATGTAKTGASEGGTAEATLGRIREIIGDGRWEESVSDEISHANAAALDSLASDKLTQMEHAVVKYRRTLLAPFATREIHREWRGVFERIFAGAAPEDPCSSAFAPVRWFLGGSKLWTRPLGDTATRVSVVYVTDPAAYAGTGVSPITVEYFEERLAPLALLRVTKRVQSERRLYAVGSVGGAVRLVDVHAVHTLRAWPFAMLESMLGEERFAELSEASAAGAMTAHGFVDADVADYVLRSATDVLTMARVSLTNVLNRGVPLKSTVRDEHSVDSDIEVPTADMVSAGARARHVVEYEARFGSIGRKTFFAFVDKMSKRSAAAHQRPDRYSTFLHSGVHSDVRVIVRRDGRRTVERKTRLLLVPENAFGVRFGVSDEEELRALPRGAQSSTRRDITRWTFPIGDANVDASMVRTIVLMVDGVDRREKVTAETFEVEVEVGHAESLPALQTLVRFVARTLYATPFIYPIALRSSVFADFNASMHNWFAAYRSGAADRLARAAFGDRRANGLVALVPDLTTRPRNISWSHVVGSGNADPVLFSKRGYTAALKTDGVTSFLFFHHTGIWIVYPPARATLVVPAARVRRFEDVFYNSIGAIIQGEQIPEENIAVQVIAHTTFAPFDLVVPPLAARVQSKAPRLDYIERFQHAVAICKDFHDQSQHAHDGLIAFHFKTVLPVGPNLDSLASAIGKLDAERESSIYKDDGFILTPAHAPVVLTPRDTDAASTKKRAGDPPLPVLKLKPWAELTIDMCVSDDMEALLVKVPGGGLAPFVGTDANPFDAETQVAWAHPLLENVPPGAVVEFGPAVRRRAYHPEEDTSAPISEEQMLSPEADSVRLEPRRIRVDKDSPNFKTFACETWHDINHPLLPHTLSKTSETLKAMFKFHNRMKRSAIRLAGAGPPRGRIVVDLGAGKGGDLSKYVGLFIAAVLVEPDAQNAAELRKRIAALQRGSFAEVVVLETPAENTAAISEAAGTLASKYHAREVVVSMMLSMTFFWKDAETVRALRQTLSAVARAVGVRTRFVFMTVDGKRMRRLLERHTGTARFGAAVVEQRGENAVWVQIDKSIVRGQEEYLVDVADLAPTLRVLRTLSIEDAGYFLSAPEREYSALFIYGEGIVSGGAVMNMPPLAVKNPHVASTSERPVVMHSADDFYTTPLELERAQFSKETTALSSNVHWGQLKLLFNEIALLSLHTTPDEDATVVYIGAAHGTHLEYLAELFPHVSFELWDPATFDPRLRTGELAHRFTIHNEFFTDAEAASLAARSNIILVSDIRTTSEGSTPTDQDVLFNMDQQAAWAEAAKPVAAMFKFRLPFDNLHTNYFQGELWIQPWAKTGSTELRLISTRAQIADGRTVRWSHSEIEEKMAWHNTVGRLRLFDFNEFEKTVANKLDACYDCTLSFVIIRDIYLGQHFKIKNASNIAVTSIMNGAFISLGQNKL